VAAAQLLHPGAWWRIPVSISQGEAATSAWRCYGVLGNRSFLSTTVTIYHRRSWQQGGEISQVISNFNGLSPSQQQDMLNIPRGL
jgi:hypothetical protein